MFCVPETLRSRKQGCPATLPNSSVPVVGKTVATENFAAAAAAGTVHSHRPRSSSGRRVLEDSTREVQTSTAWIASAGFVAVETAPPKNLARRATVVVVAAADGGVAAAVAALPMLRRGVRTTAAAGARSVGRAAWE